MAEQLVAQPHGGALKRGNTKNTGRNPKTVRAKYLQTADRAHKQIEAMVAWKPCMPIPGRAGVKPTYRIPTPAEWQWACDVALKYGLGVRQDVDVTSDGEALNSAPVVVYLPHNGRDNHDSAATGTAD